ncbi:MAG TPA: bacillithiol system redox-active protein YtxJ [Cyclobacteriaceae bacterium]|nr:bacillithiol system redox-active protein YtxJ [Cyclobacteriaceae bacterium]
MEWEDLTTLSQIEEIQNLSNDIPVLIYKHSSRCSTSYMVLSRLERNSKIEGHQYFKPFFLDLIAYRDISNAIAATFRIEHESPQVLLIHKGQSIYTSSHLGINYQDILNAVKN